MVGAASAVIAVRRSVLPRELRGRLPPSGLFISATEPDVEPTNSKLNNTDVWGVPSVRLDMYSISLFLGGSVEGTPGFGIGSIRTIPRERPTTMMERRECCVRGTSLTLLSTVITCHGTMSLLTTTSSPGIWVTTVVQYNFASCVIRQTRLLGVLLLCSICNITSKYGVRELHVRYGC